MNRREFVKTGATLALGAITIAASALAAGEPTLPNSPKLPRWRGFNLSQKFVRRPGGNPPFAEVDFALMQEWGFDFSAGYSTRSQTVFKCAGSARDMGKSGGWGA